jgi:hypothetical protein
MGYYQNSLSTPINDVFSQMVINTVETIQRKEKQLSEFSLKHGKQHNHSTLLKLQIIKLREKAGILNADLSLLKQSKNANKNKRS